MHMTVALFVFVFEFTLPCMCTTRTLTHQGIMMAAADNAAPDEGSSRAPKRAKTFNEASLATAPQVIALGEVLKLCGFTACQPFVRNVDEHTASAAAMTKASLPAGSGKLEHSIKLVGVLGNGLLKLFHNNVFSLEGASLQTTVISAQHFFAGATTHSAVVKPNTWFLTEYDPAQPAAPYLLKASMLGDSNVLQLRNVKLSEDMQFLVKSRDPSRESWPSIVKSAAARTFSNSELLPLALRGTTLGKALAGPFSPPLAQTAAVQKFLETLRSNISCAHQLVHVVSNRCCVCGVIPVGSSPGTTLALTKV
jgi:hypothetical protein